MTNWRQERQPAGRIERIGVDELLALAARRAASCRLSTCASARSGTQGTCGARCSWRGTTSRSCPQSLDPTRPDRQSSALRGVRAATAASLLKRVGAEQVIHVVDGGVPALARLGLELESAAPAGLVG